MEVRTSDGSITDTSKDAMLFNVIYQYDIKNRLSGERIYAGSQSPYVSYSYNENGQPQQSAFSTGKTLNYTYDPLGRLIQKNLNTQNPVAYDYSYHTSERNTDGSTVYTTTQVENEVFGQKGYSYEYDIMGNIVSISEGTRSAAGSSNLSNTTEKVTYEYDDKNQLIRENNLYLNKTIVYTYDTGGNILNKKLYAYTTAENLSGLTAQTITYTYDSTWKDQLKTYNGQSITYDAIGNPLSYRGKTLSWNGRKLASLSQGTGSSAVNVSYIYDSDGLRTKKTVGSTESEYYYSGGQLVYEKRGTEEFYYSYNAEGQLAVIQYVTGGNTYTYYPALNIRGDVEALYNESGSLVVQYIYDSWGKIISVSDTSGRSIGTKNPFRYRGYYYDEESGLHYLRSRYYDPEVGRFINADSLIDNQGIITQNLFQYCGNDPVNNSDPEGHSFLPIIIGGVVGGILGGFGAYITGESVVAGALNGAATAVLMNFIGGAIITKYVAGKICAANTLKIGAALLGYVGTAGAVSAVVNVAEQGVGYVKENVNLSKLCKKKEPLKELKKHAQNFAEQINYQEVKSAAHNSMSFAPLSFVSGTLIEKAFWGAPQSLTNGIAKEIGNFFMEINNTMLNIAVDLFQE